MEESEKVIQRWLEGEGKGPRIKILTPLHQRPAGKRKEHVPLQSEVMRRSFMELVYVRELRPQSLYGLGELRGNLTCWQRR